MINESDPFAILGIAPTLQRAAIKRAYFSLLSKHSPHADPQGFRRLRDAYELLMGPGLLDAWVGADIDVAAELESLEGELGERVALAEQSQEAARFRQHAIAAFEATLRLDLGSARARILRK